MLGTFIAAKHFLLASAPRKIVLHFSLDAEAFIIVP
jgi:hypothetical protein